MKDTKNFNALLALIEHTKEDEIVANGLKVLRLIMKELNYRSYISAQMPMFINRVIVLLQKFASNVYVKKEIF